MFNKRTEKILGKAQEAIQNNNYHEAEKLVLKSIGIDSCNVKSYLLLSDISDELGKTEQRKQALIKVTTLDPANYPVAYKLLASIFFTSGDYINALKNYGVFRQYGVTRDSLFVAERINSCRFAIASLKQNRNLQITRLDSTVNSSLQEYWPAISTNDSLLYFTRLIQNERQYPFERIFISKRNDSGWGKSFRMEFSDNDDVNIGTMCLSSDGKLLFFTTCGRNDGNGSCDIYYARKLNNYWSRPKNAGLPVNSSYWEAQPSISSDNQYLFFASNRPDGLGGMDIWCCKVVEDAEENLTFLEPKNLGLGVNSREDDFSPYIHADGSTLYYSSKGKYGMGENDLFISKLKDSVWEESVNLGYPINTRFNEDGLVVSPTCGVAVFSSDREGSIDGSKDIFQLVLPVEFLPEKVGYIRGFVFNSETGDRLLATIDITQLELKNSKTIISDQTDGYITTLVAGKTYAMNVNMEGYLFYSRHFDMKMKEGFQQAEQVDIFLDPIKAGKSFIMSNIFFDFDSDKLKEESYPELMQLKEFLIRNPLLRIEISGHTDDLGNADYNLKLSCKRAKSIFDFLKQYIESARMFFIGNGEEFPIAPNDNEQGRKQNRRSEIKILSL